MKVILLQDVAKIGRKFEIKNVSDGHALNFLIPKKLAKIATASALKDLESLKVSYEEKEKEKEDELIANIMELKDSTITITAKVSKEGSLFAGIDKGDLLIAIKDQKALDLNEDNIVLEKPIKDANEHIIKIKANGEKAEFKLVIVAKD